MKQIGVSDAKTHLSELIDDGVSVTITKRGKPIAVLTPVRENPKDVIARIRAMRSDGASLNMKAIVDTARAGRR